MRPILFFILMITIIACDPYKFGFKYNPAFVLDEALKSIFNMDEESFLEVSGGEALCIYGNSNGMTYLKENVRIGSQDVKLKWKTFDKKLEVPEYVGFWSFFNSKYVIDIQDKKSDVVYAQVLVDCHYGISGPRPENIERLLNLRPKNYKTKECRLIKVMPGTFKPLPLPEKCKPLKVDLPS